MKMKIGEKIRALLHENRMSVQDFAKKINKSRSAVYAIFEKDTIDTGLLEEISKVLDHNFFLYYLIDKDDVKEPAGSYLTKVQLTAKLKKKLKTSEQETQELKEKYEVLRKYTQLLEEKVKNAK